MSGSRTDLARAVDLTRTGDVWLFRGHSVADRAIQLTTNSPVNHVGMAVALDDLPPLMWHAELGRSLPDVWSGTRHRGVQLHLLEDAVRVWGTRYGQSAWLRQLDAEVTRQMEDAALRVIARLDGTPFPSTARLAARWFGGRVPRPSRASLLARTRGLLGRPAADEHPGQPAAGRRGPGEPPVPGADRARLETAYCAEIVAVTYQAMGLLPATRRPNWYDPGRFWSGDELELQGGARLEAEIAVDTREADR